MRTRNVGCEAMRKQADQECFLEEAGVPRGWREEGQVQDWLCAWHTYIQSMGTSSGHLISSAAGQGVGLCRAETVLSVPKCSLQGSARCRVEKM